MWSEITVFIWKRNITAISIKKRRNIMRIVVAAMTMTMTTAMTSTTARVSTDVFVVAY